jgi:ABC-type sulfate transport system permease subunit
LNKLIQQANEWLRSEQERLQSAVCNDPKIYQLATTEADATKKLIRVVADVISSLTIFVPVGTVAEIILRDGIPTYCKDIWEASS